MGEKLNKPLIIITAALSIAVITLSVQVVLLTFSVKDQKDTVRQLLNRTNTAYAVENRYTELNGSLQQLRREAESIKNDTISLSAELNSLREIIAKINTDAQFMQIELNDVSARIMHLEKVRNTTSAAAQSISDEASALQGGLTSEQNSEPNDARANELNTVYPTRQMDDDNVYFEGSEPPSSLSVTSIPATNVSLSPEDAAKLEKSK